MVPVGREPVSMAKGVGAALTVIARTFWTACPFESCKVNSVSLVAVAAVGTPAIFPVDGVNVSPSGNAGEPVVKLQV
jgi:hypothetical protein